MFLKVSREGYVDRGPPCLLCSHTLCAHTNVVGTMSDNFIQEISYSPLLNPSKTALWLDSTVRPHTERV